MIDFKHYKGAWVVAVIVSGIALFLDVLVASGVRKALRSESFETTPGVITRSEIEGGHKGELDHEVEYQYEVNGTRYTNQEYHVQPQFLGNGYWRAAHNANPMGKAVTVHYDPSDPNTAYLVPGLRSDLLFVAWWATAVSLLALGLLLNGLWSLWGRRAFDPARHRCVRQTRDGWVARPDPTTRFVVPAFVVLLVTFGAGCFLTLGYAAVFESSPPWIVPVAMFVAAPVIAVYFGKMVSREGLLFINDRDGTVELTFGSERVVPARELLGIDVATRTRSYEGGKPYEEFTVSLRWRDKFDQEQVTKLAEYTEDANAAALVAWLRERLALPVTTSTAV